MEEKQMLEFFASKEDLKQGLGGLREEVRGMITETRSEILTHLDKQLVILQRLDQERVFTTEHIRRIEERVESAEKDIKTLKVRLAIA